MFSLPIKRKCVILHHHLTSKTKYYMALKTYAAPHTEMRGSYLRMTILAGSQEPKQVTKGKDFEGWNARERSVKTTVDGENIFVE